MKNKKKLIDEILIKYVGDFKKYPHIVSGEISNLELFSITDLSTILNDDLEKNDKIKTSIKNLRRIKDIICIIKKADKIGAYEVTEHMSNKNDK